jgi:putative salt-induced outer membrane protein YdiY
MLIPHRRLLCALTIVASLALTAPLRADFVTVKNGDTLNGEIQGLEKGKLALKTDYAGTINIAWDQVVSVASDKALEIEVATGKRIRGVIEQSNGHLAITDEDVSWDVNTVDIVGIIPMEDGDPPGFWERLNGSVDLGYSFTRGNSRLNQSSVGISGNYRREGYKLQGDIRSLFSQQNDAPTVSRHTANARYDLYLSPRSFSFALAGLERNDRQRLALRSTAGGGFGWSLVKSKANELAVLGGVTFINEQFQLDANGEMPPRNSSGEALAGVEWDTTRYERIQFSTKLTLHPSLSESGRYRLQYDSTVRFPVFQRLTWSMSLFDRFDSDPPLMVQRNDYGAVASLGFGF